MTAKNGIGWELQEYSLTRGWERSIMFPAVFRTYYEALEVYRTLYDKESFRVYEALYGF